MAQDLSVLARIDPGASRITDKWGRTEVRLHLSQGVPHRVFTLASPPRLVVDFQEVEFGSLRESDLQPSPGRLTSLRFGAFRPGWSRLVADLSEPLGVKEVGMAVSKDTGKAVLRIDLEPIDSDSFAARANPPPNSLWELAAVAPPPRLNDDSFVVVIDPGHGGVDPGAVRENTSEKALMLQMAIALRDKLRRSGQAEVILTRDRDMFVSLPARVALAHQVRADLFLSLHADALSQGRARGTTVYTLSKDASDAASAQLAAQHNRADLISGLDLSSADDEVAAVLMSLARQETKPRTQALSAAIVRQVELDGLPVNSRPERQAAFSVLKSADIPSVLVEVGFLSDKRDLQNLRDPIWRDAMVDALADAILVWRADDLATRALVRQ